MQGLSQLIKADDSHKKILGEMLLAAAEIARQEKLEDGYRIVINDGKNGCKKHIYLGQSVYYIHIHILGGAKFSWPPGTNF